MYYQVHGENLPEGVKHYREIDETNNVCNMYKYNSLLHREDGPALIDKDQRRWYIHGKLHRVDGPTVEYINGKKEYWKHGKLHREDGPAITAANGVKVWMIEGENLKCFSQKDFERLMKLRIFW